jgi:hypothetical protein
MEYSRFRRRRNSGTAVRVQRSDIVKSTREPSLMSGQYNGRRIGTMAGASTPSIQSDPVRHLFKLLDVASDFPGRLMWTIGTKARDICKNPADIK